METIRYGDGALPLPPSLRDLPVLAAEGLPPHPEPARLVRRAADEAARRVAGLLREAGRGARLALVVPDRTRPLPLPEILPPVLDALSAEGVPPARITIVPASGIHRPMSRAEVADWIGEDAAASGALLAPHDADRPALLLGRTPTGIPVSGHPAVATAGAVLALGRIVFHYLAGFGGGRKMLVPGVSSRRTILAMHARCLDPRPGHGRHPRARTGLLDGNPVHAAAVEAARRFPPTACWHVLTALDGSLADIEVGDPFEDHARAARRYGDARAVKLPEPLDGVVVSAGGHPTDRDLVQAHKALEAVAGVVRDGGVVVWVARCGDGIGNPELLEGFRLGSVEAIDRELRRDFRVGVHSALALLQKTRRLRVLAVTELDDEIVRLAGMTRVASLDEAAEILREELGEGARVALAPSGASLLYRLASPS